MTALYKSSLHKQLKPLKDLKGFNRSSVPQEKKAAEATPLIEERISLLASQINNTVSSFYLKIQISLTIKHITNIFIILQIKRYAISSCLKGSSNLTNPLVEDDYR